MLRKKVQLSSVICETEWAGNTHIQIDRYLVILKQDVDVSCYANVNL